MRFLRLWLKTACWLVLLFTAYECFCMFFGGWDYYSDMQEQMAAYGQAGKLLVEHIWHYRGLLYVEVIGILVVSDICANKFNTNFAITFVILELIAEVCEQVFGVAPMPEVAKDLYLTSLGWGFWTVAGASFILSLILLPFVKNKKTDKKIYTNYSNNSNNTAPTETSYKPVNHDKEDKKDDEYKEEDIYESYIILGLPNSGKSVYFSVVMDYFQREFNSREDDYALTFSELQTDETVRGTMNALRRGEWPQHTQGAPQHTVQFSFRNSQKKLVAKNLQFVDCGGETFQEIFGVAVDQNNLSNEARNVLGKIYGATGIIFVLSAETLKDIENNNLATTLFNLLHYLEHSNHMKKLALVITKGDELGDKLLSVKEAKEHFAEQQPSAFARIRTLKSNVGKCNVNFFVVSSVKAEIASSGEKTPPVNYSSCKHSMNIADPIVWMLDINMKK